MQESRNNAENNDNNNNFWEARRVFRGPGCPQEIACIMLFQGTIIARITTSMILTYHYQRHKPATHRNIPIKQDLILNMAIGCIVRKYPNYVEG